MGANIVVATVVNRWNAETVADSALRDELGLHIDTPCDDAPERGCAYGAPCMAAFSQLAIDPDLQVRPCDRLVDVFVGDLHRESLAGIWNGHLRHEPTEEWLKEVGKPL